MALPFAISWISAGIVVAGTPEQNCQSGRAKAAGIYAKCAQVEVGKQYGGSSTHLVTFVRCWTKYAATWNKLQAKALASPAGETCDARGSWTTATGR